MLKRLVSSLVLALVAGALATFVSVLPALFIQSVFIGEAQRCEDQIRFEEAAFDETRTQCEEELGGTPFWFPILIIAVGGVLGGIGGFAYGMVRTSPRGRQPQSPSRPYLPF